ncbi:MAG: DUF1015 domain-containing protein [Endomicrobiales bacterium]|nr:DUF1015 domain-containing protein [Endomicrobiales bacterium]
MAKVRPFYGIRYESGNITKQICPPYDIISKAEKKRLKKMSPYNMVRLELPDKAGGLDKYRHSAKLMKQWLDRGVLVRDDAPAFYAYEQVFSDHGRKMTRRGFFACLKIENPHRGSVKPHERTLSKPKEDRLKLLKATKANLSPIFGLFNDKNRKMVRLLRKISSQKGFVSAKDGEGTLHRLWQVTEPEFIGTAEKTLGSQKVFIADGHHRYETSWNYLREKKKADRKYSVSSEYNYVMIFLCPMEDPGLSIWPTHRVVREPRDLEERIEKYFNVLPASAYDRLKGRLPQPLLLVKGGKKRTLVIKKGGTLDAAMPGKCRSYKELGVSILHSILLKDVPPENITYVKDAGETVALARKKKCLAVIVPATPIEAVKNIALANQTMPQKSTYFFPKVASGIVIHGVK